MSSQLFTDYPTGHLAASLRCSAAVFRNVDEALSSEETVRNAGKTSEDPAGGER